MKERRKEKKKRKLTLSCNVVSLIVISVFFPMNGIDIEKWSQWDDNEPKIKCMLS